MTAETLRLERRYDVPIARVFDIVTRADYLVQWWGPEGIKHVGGDLDLTTLGPWNATLTSAEGGRYKVSGVVTKLDPPHVVAFTWGWHDDREQRGIESHVTITLSDEGGGTRFVLSHADLPNNDQVQRHSEGWASSLRKLDRVVSSPHA